MRILSREKKKENEINYAMKKKKKESENCALKLECGIVSIKFSGINIYVICLILPSKPLKIILNS